MITYFYKIIFDISLYYAFVSFFLCYINAAEYKAELNTFGLFLAAALLCVWSEGKKTRERTVQLAAACLPGIALLWEYKTGRVLEFLIPWIYFVSTIIRQQYEVYYLNFKNTFRRVLFVFLLPFLLFFFDSNRGIVALTESAPFLLVFFTSGVLLLQVLRYTPQSKDKKLFEKRQIGQAAAFFLVCLAATTGGIFQIAGNFLWEKAIRPVFLGMIGGIWFAAQWIFLQIQKIKKKVYFGDIQDNNIEPLPAETLLEGEIESVPPSEIDKAPTDLTPVFIIVGIAAVVILFLLLRGNLRQGKKKNMAVREEREEIKEAKEKSVKLKKHSRDRRITVRYQYQRFMKKLDAGKRRLKSSDTTGQIGRKYIASYAQDSKRVKEVEEVTEIYRQVRYGEKEVSRQEAHRIKELVEKL